MSQIREFGLQDQQTPMKNNHSQPSSGFFAPGQSLILRITLTAAALFGLLLVAGCGSSPTPESLARESAARAVSVSGRDGSEAAGQNEGGAADGSETAADNGNGGLPKTEAQTSLAELLLSEEDRAMLRRRTESNAAQDDRLPEIDEERVKAAGIRKIEGEHLTLYTDLPSKFEIDDIPNVFDKAVPEWCEYFEVPLEKVADWKLVGYLIQSKEKYKQAGLMPPDLPSFLHGYQRGREMWVYEQPSDYYRRHLVLHEGVHGFMNYALGGAGPPWYREGMAELLGTHLWKHGKLTVGYFPKDRDEVPYWGRIKLLKDELAAGRGQLLREVMNQQQKDHLRLVPYAWSWAATAFLDSHPRYRVGFRDLKDNVAETSGLFSRGFEARYRSRMREMEEEWQLFILELEYGYDFTRNAIQYAAGLPLPEGGRSAIVATDRGWQSTGIRLERGKSYRIVSKGRYKVRKSPTPWWSEPGGITIDYWKGYPLGILQGVVRADDAESDLTSMGRPFSAGLSRKVTPTATGTLYLRINDSPANLIDNEGQVNVKVMDFEAAGAPAAGAQGGAGAAKNQ